MALCDSEEEKLVRWAAHRDTPSHWVALVRKLLLIQPSSAAAERVFSVLSRGLSNTHKQTPMEWDSNDWYSIGELHLIMRT